MNNKNIAAILCIEPHELTRWSQQPRGSFFVWVLRQILMTKWFDLAQPHKDWIIETLKELVSNKPIVAESISTGLIDGYVIVPIPYIQQLIDAYKSNNPFVKKVNDYE